jgi:hypothetical protein
VRLYICPATTFHQNVALSFVIPSKADLSRRAVGPERTRISCHAALDMATCAAFIKESRMKINSATKLNRKSGVAQWRDLRFALVFLAFVDPKDVDRGVESHDATGQLSQ